MAEVRFYGWVGTVGQLPGERRKCDLSVDTNSGDGSTRWERDLNWMLIAATPVDN